MTYTTSPDPIVVYGIFDANRPSPPLPSPAHAGASIHPIWQVPDEPAQTHPSPDHAPPSTLPQSVPPGDGGPKKKRKGAVLLDADVLRGLRESRMLSQEELANLFDLRNVQISIATIKRAETWHAVRCRIAREFAAFFDVPVESLLKR